MTDWSPQQNRALRLVDNWLTGDRSNKLFRLFGYAGTGKSTLAQYLGKLEVERGGFVQYAAFTGKAGVVMRKKGCANARTLHSVLYDSHDKNPGELLKLEGRLDQTEGRARADLMREIEAERERLKQPGFRLKSDPLQLWRFDEEYGESVRAGRITMFIIDECSMVGDDLGSDLMSLEVPVLVLGDPAQLPPVASAGYFTKCDKPDITLTEIHRQAADSPIIKMATTVRSGNTLDVGDYGNGCSVVNVGNVTREEWMEADQILVGKNDTRKRFNGRVRQLRGFSGFLPMPGEKLVCLRNNHAHGLLNGSLWECQEAVDDPKGSSFKLAAKSIDDGKTEVVTFVHKAPFMGEEVPIYERRDADEFDFGYALTVHKSQGSQWDNVMLYDEWFHRDSRKQWLYTGLTRAAERVKIVRD